MTSRRVLLDENVPVPLRHHLSGIEAITVQFMGWKGVLNGELVRHAKTEGFAVLLTADRLLAFTPRIWSPLGCVYVDSTDFERLRPAADRIGMACRTVLPGQVLVVEV